MNALNIADRYDAAIRAADDVALRGCYSAGARIWHNSDGRDQSVEENLKLAKWLRRKLPDAQFTDVRNIATAEGFVRLSVLRGTTAAAKRIVIPTCLVAFTNADGLIGYVEEYLDPSPLVTAGADE